jgi:hypothetical protein
MSTVVHINRLRRAYGQKLETPTSMTKLFNTNGS